jgi:hypothetical protein
MRAYGTIVVACVAAACGGGSEPGAPSTDDAAAVIAAGEVRFTADTRILESFPVQLHTSVTATNDGDEPVQLTFPDGCVVLLRAYRDGGGEPVWDQRAEMACTAALVQETLAPGTSQTWEARTDARAILGTSHPDGRYRLEAYLRPRTGTVAVPAGTADLAVPRS